MVFKRLLPLVVPAAILVSTLLFATLWPSDQGARALPPAGADVLNVNAQVTAITRLGLETVNLTGSATVDRGEPYMDGDIEVADAQITELHLNGTGLAGPIEITGGPFAPSNGQLRSLQAGQQFPASSYFDVYADVNIVASPAGALLLHNTLPFHLSPRNEAGTEVPIDGWPPSGVTYRLEPIFNVDNDGDTQVDEDTPDDDGDGLYDEDRPGVDPDSPGPDCGLNADCDTVEGEDPPAGFCPAAMQGTPTLCDDDGDGQIDEDPGCIPLYNAAGTNLKAGICVRNISITIKGAETPTPTLTPCPPEICTPTPTEPLFSPTPTRTPTITPFPTPTPTPPGGVNPSFSVAPGGPSGIHPAAIVGMPGAPEQVSGNDNFVNAWGIFTIPFIGGQTTGGATTEAGENLNPAGCVSGNQKSKTVWYRYAPPTAGPVFVDTRGSTFDTVLAAYTGLSFATLTPVACNDDIGGPLQSEITFNATAGVTYYFQIGGYGDQSGTLQLNVSRTAPAGQAAGAAPLLTISCLNMGLVADGCDDGSDGDQDDVDAFSFRTDFLNGPAPVEFSVAPGSVGQPGSGVAGQAGCSAPQPQADAFTTNLNGTNALLLDGDGGGGGGCPTAPPLGLQEIPTSDNLDGLSSEPIGAVDEDGDGRPNQPIFFSLAAGSPTLLARGRLPADIMWTVDARLPGLYAAAQTLGLQPADDIDAVCLKDFSDGVPSYSPITDIIRFSLAPGSPSLATLGASAADILGPGPEVVYDAEEMGLRPEDNLDAVTCFTPSGGGTATPTVHATPSGTRTPTGLVGDANCNSAVNSIDGLLVLQYVASLLGSLPCPGLADANQNGVVNSVDAALILQFDAGLLPGLPP